MSDAVAPSAIVGSVRIRATASDPAKAVFVGIAPLAPGNTYLAGVGRALVTNWATGTANYHQSAGQPPPAPPTRMSIWVAAASGTGAQTLTWKPTSGDWLVVVMNSDASPGVSVTADAGATIPALGWIAGGLLVAGGVLLISGTVLIAVPVVRAHQRSAQDG